MKRLPSLSVLEGIQPYSSSSFVWFRIKRRVKRTLLLGIQTWKWMLRFPLILYLISHHLSNVVEEKTISLFYFFTKSFLHGLFNRWRLNHCAVWKSRAPETQWRGVTCQKNGDSKRVTLPLFKKDEFYTYFELLTFIVPYLPYLREISKMTAFKVWLFGAYYKDDR